MRINPPNNGTPPTNPYHIARAYGVSPAGRAAPVAKVTQVGAGTPSAAAAETQPSGRPENLRRLVAGEVPGGVRFDAGGAGQPTEASLPMYRHPADKNAAATAVSVGRSLDVRG